MITVNAIRCPKCGDTIYSRARHDYRGCTCGAIAIDGGFDYTRVSADPDVFGQLETVKLEVDATKVQLYQDWNHGGETYGCFNIPFPVTREPA